MDLECCPYPEEPAIPRDYYLGQTSSAAVLSGNDYIYPLYFWEALDCNFSTFLVPFLQTLDLSLSEEPSLQASSSIYPQYFSTERFWIS
jgi:hypothetical protein